ncbi:hypothetical protein ACJROX_12970 [Pseudalkalibacillus sp. A8]|uniref:hypothetical protein n=1 Tax=Pseudalkalibacillus sp. A8 TaxID=3382641 RepID=UPI0038B4FECB
MMESIQKPIDVTETTAVSKSFAPHYWMGLTGDLTSFGKIIFILIMFIGKLGPLTLAFSLAKQKTGKILDIQEEIY